MILVVAQKSWGLISLEGIQGCLLGDRQGTGVMPTPMLEDAHGRKLGNETPSSAYQHEHAPHVVLHISLGSRHAVCSSVI
jgi:hypothetical protein